MTEPKSVNWHEFDNLHVIKRLRELIKSFWNVQVHFTDEKGLLRGVQDGKFFSPLNPISSVITGDDRGFAATMKTVKQTSIEAAYAKKAKMVKNEIGFSTLLVPIRVKDTFLGCAFADGFIEKSGEKEQKRQIANSLERMFPEKASSLMKHLDEIPSLTEKDINHLTELTETVVNEMLIAYANLSDQKQKVTKLKDALGTRYTFDKMIGKSSVMQDLYRLLDRVCDAEVTVLIQGENGTGKELIAKALHYNSKRSSSNFMVVNCGAFNENLLESELFGHVKGSFTGAVRDKKGLFESADGGTLFLDEIGDTVLAMQVKLLRVLQEGTFTPVGSTELKRANVRVVAATNKDLQKMVQEGTFREDLYYRLNVINVRVPPLRERKEDILLLVDHFLKKYAKKYGGKQKKVDKNCFEQLLDHNWPGNVRELENEIERLCVLSGEKEQLTADSLSTRIQEATKTNTPSGIRIEGKLKEALEELEKEMIVQGLKRTKYNKSQLAKQLGISRAGLIMKVDKYGLDKRNAD